jgi:hypothetical protein
MRIQALRLVRSAGIAAATRLLRIGRHQVMFRRHRYTTLAGSEHPGDLNVPALEPVFCYAAKSLDVTLFNTSC